MSSPDNRFEQFKEFLSKTKKIVIVPHKDPDGDAIGASLAWYNVLTKCDFEVCIVSPSELPVGLSWMNGFEEIMVFEENPMVSTTKINECDLLFFLDFNSISRVGKIKELLKNSLVPKVVIDHHPYPEDGIGDLMFSETEVSSTCELSYNVMMEMGFEVDLAEAECLYAGIMTDTGILSYNSSRPEIYHVVADLISKGVDKDKVHREVFHSNSLDRMLLLGHALCNKLEVLPGLPVAFISLSNDDLVRYNFKPGDTEGLVNYPLSIDGIDISALFIEKEDKFVKASFRSRGKVAINKFSELYFNGGGHLNAAGGEMHDTLDNSIIFFKSAIESFLANNGITCENNRQKVKSED